MADPEFNPVVVNIPGLGLRVGIPKDIVDSIGEDKFDVEDPELLLKHKNGSPDVIIRGVKLVDWNRIKTKV